LSVFMAVFWLARLLQWFYYDAGLRPANRSLAAMDARSLLCRVGIFGWSAVYPSR